MKIATIVTNNPNNDIAKPVDKFSFIRFNSSKNISMPPNVKNTPNNITITKKIAKTLAKKNLLIFIVIYYFIGPTIVQSCLLPLNSEAAG